MKDWDSFPVYDHSRKQSWSYQVELAPADFSFKLKAFSIRTILGSSSDHRSSTEHSSPGKGTALAGMPHSP